MSQAADPRAGGPHEGPPAAEFVDISKRFGRVVACDHIDLAIHRGQIHGILGENGAGKSTLVSIAAGRLAADAGEVFLEGRAVRFRRARDARDAGLALVPQHDLLVGAATVADNLALLDRRARFFESARARRARVTRLTKAFGLDLGDAGDRADGLPVGTRQRVEIAGALAGEPRVLILDEPTAVLSPDETAVLFAALRRRAEAGAAIVLITHRLAEVFAGADRLTLLSRGRTVRTCRTDETTAAEIGGLLIAGSGEDAREREKEEEKIFSEGEESGGARVPLESRPGLAARGGETQPSRKAARSAAFPVPTFTFEGKRPHDNLEVRDFRPAGTPPKPEPLSLSLSPGDLLVLLAIDGNGADTIASAIAGLVPFAGEVRVGGVVLPSAGDPLAFRAAGGAFVPADRREEGLVLELDLAENLALPRPPGRFLLDRAAMGESARRRIAAFAVRAPSPSIRAGALSGGNQQKLVLAREVSPHPRVLLVGQPTRGVDIGAIEFIHGRLRAMRDDGSAVLMVSSDLDEIFALADRVMVMSRGRANGELPIAACTEAVLGRLMGDADAAAVVRA